MARPSVLLLHNTAAPYRLPLFNALARLVDLEVVFCQVHKADRLWQVDLADYDFAYQVLANQQYRLGDKSLLVNPDLLPLLLRRSYDAYVLGHGAGMAPAILIAMSVAKLKRRPIILWSGNVDVYAGQAQQPQPLEELWLRSVLYRWPDAFIAYGQQTAKHLQRLGVPAESIYTGTQVIWPEQLPLPSLTKEELGLAGRKVVLTINYLTERKGVKYLIEAFQALKRTDAVLVIAGDGPARPGLEALAVDQNIRFVGHVEGAIKSSYYAAADLFVLPTLFDVWGLVVNEAMHFGLPILTTYGANCVELQQENALVVTPGEVAGLQQALQQLLDNDDLRRQMGLASQRLIQQHSGALAVETFRRAILAVTPARVKRPASRQPSQQN